MNLFVRVLALLIFGVNCCNAQIDELNKFIPKGYVLFQRYDGDLNGDGQDDCVLIIKNTEKNNVVLNQFDKKVDRNRRGILVLIKKDKDYSVADKNYTCFSSENEDGGIYYAPELEIEIIEQNLIVHYAHGRYGYWRYIFKIQDSDYKLIGFYSSSNRGPITNRETSINFLTRKKLIRENTNKDSEGGDEIFKETWFDIEIDKLISLSEIIDFDELEMFEY